MYQYMDDDMKEYFKDEVYEGINEIDGKLYYIPTCGTTGRLIYNKEIFERVGIKNPPTTMEEMVEDARLITSQLSGEGIYGYAQHMKSGLLLNHVSKKSLQNKIHIVLHILEGIAVEIQFLVKIIHRLLSFAILPYLILFSFIKAISFPNCSLVPSAKKRTLYFFSCLTAFRSLSFSLSWPDGITVLVQDCRNRLAIFQLVNADFCHLNQSHAVIPPLNSSWHRTSSTPPFLSNFCLQTLPESTSQIFCHRYVCIGCPLTPAYPSMSYS